MECQDVAYLILRDQMTQTSLPSLTICSYMLVGDMASKSQRASEYYVTRTAQQSDSELTDHRNRTE